MRIKEQETRLTLQEHDDDDDDDGSDIPSSTTQTRHCRASMATLSIFITLLPAHIQKTTVRRACNFAFPKMVTRTHRVVALYLHCAFWYYLLIYT